MPFCVHCHASISNEAMVVLDRCKCGAALPKPYQPTTLPAAPLDEGRPIEDYPIEGPVPEPAPSRRRRRLGR